MLFSCVICAELINPSDDAHVTACGHIFHYVCLCQWLERSKTCPQCRNKCNLGSLRRIYFNISNVDTNEANISSLQEQLENANLKNKIATKDLEEAKKQIVDLKLTQKNTVKTISKLEEKAAKFEFMANSYSEMINTLRSENKLLVEYKKQVNELKQRLDLMSTVQTILDDTVSDVEQLLKDENNPRILGTWVTTLRRELKQSETKKSDLRKSLQSMQNDLRKSREQKSILEEKVTSLESENYRLLDKIKELEATKEDTSFAETKSPSTNKLDTSTKDVSNVLKDKISPRMFEKIRKIEESSSPYFNIKSSAVGLNIFGKFKEKLSEDTPGTMGVLRKSPSDLGEQYSIFKKPRLESTSMKTLNSSLVFNGFGGSEKREVSFGFGKIDKKKLTVNERLKSGKLKKFPS